MREVVEARRKRPGRRPAAPVEQGGEDAAGFRQPRRPRFHGWDTEREMARGHHPGSRPGTGRACLSLPVDCHDSGIVAYTAGSGPNAGLADRMLVKAVETLPEGAHPLVRSDRGCHCRWPGWLDLMDRYGLTRSTGAKGLFPGRRRRGGVPRTHEDGIRLSRALEGAYPRRDARLDRRLHPLARPRAHQTVARLDESCAIPSKPGNGCVIISKKTSAAPYLHLKIKAKNIAVSLTFP